MKYAAPQDAICLICGEFGIHAHTITSEREAGVYTPIAIGTVLYGYCGGFFGREGYGPHRVEALGADWIVVRHIESGRVYHAADSDRSDYPAAGTILRHLAEYTVKPDEET